MYGQIVARQPTNWWGEPMPGDYIIQSEFLADLDSISKAKSVTIRMNSLGGDAGVSILIHNRLRELAAKGTALICIVDGVAMSGGSKDGCFVLVFNQRPDAPRISSPQAGQRVKTGFYLEFLPAADAEGDAQFFQAEVTPDPSFSSGVSRFTEGLEKWDGTGWQPAQAAGEGDAGTLFRLPVEGLPLNADLYARVSATD